VPPPGDEGTTTLTGRAGHASWADAEPLASAKATAKKVIRRCAADMMFSSETMAKCTERD
jgi:hypothetical protein